MSFYDLDYILLGVCCSLMTPVLSWLEQETIIAFLSCAVKSCFLLSGVGIMMTSSELVMTFPAIRLWRQNDFGGASPRSGFDHGNLLLLLINSGISYLPGDKLWWVNACSFELKKFKGRDRSSVSQGQPGLLSEVTVNMKYRVSTLEQQIERNSKESSSLFSKILSQIIYPIPILE